MNKSLKGLLAALVAVTPAFAASTSDDNKTHLNTRLCRSNIPAYTTFNEMKADKNEDRLGGNIQVTGFYGRSVNGKHIAKSFGADGAETINVIDGVVTTLNTTRPNVINDLLLHNTNDDGTLTGILNFNPRQTVYGVDLTYFQRFDKWFDGLFFALNIPVVHVRNDINMSVEKGTDHNDSGGSELNRIKLYDLFTGKEIARDLAADKHMALKYAKMCNNSNTGLDDIEAQIGWIFLEGSKYHVSSNISVLFPTGDKPDAQYLWGARTGESKWGLGLGTDASAILWEEEDQNLKIQGSLQYKYLFDGTEKRTLGLNELRYYNGTTVDLVKFPILSPYYLVGEKNKAGLKPLANVSTLDVTVKPGSQIDGIISFAYNNGGFTLDFGYNLFWKEREEVELKGSCGANTGSTTSVSGWTENTYGVANDSYVAASTFEKKDTLAKNIATDAQAFIQSGDLCHKLAETPAQIKHKVFAGIGYYAKNWDYPVMVGTGVGYEFSSSNRDALEGYSFWAKAGVAF